MPRLWKPFFLVLFCVCPLLLTPAESAQAQPQTAPAQRVAPAAAKADSAKGAAAAAAAAPAQTTEEQVTVRHPRPFGVSARGSWLLPVHILKKNERNINDITGPAPAFDAGLCWYAMDGFRVSARMMRGGLKMTDNAFDLRGHVPPSDSPFSVTPALGPNSFLKMDTYSLSASAFLGNKLFPGSRFNPYLTAIASRASWKLSVDGRSGAAHRILETPLEGTDFSVGGGLGAEYELAGALLLDVEWTWQYILTSFNQNVTQNKPQFDVWTNTHFWDFSLGLIYTF